MGSAILEFSWFFEFLAPWRRDLHVGLVARKERKDFGAYWASCVLVGPADVKTLSFFFLDEETVELDEASHARARHEYTTTQARTGSQVRGGAAGWFVCEAPMPKSCAASPRSPARAAGTQPTATPSDEEGIRGRSGRARMAVRRAWPGGAGTATCGRVFPFLGVLGAGDLFVLPLGLSPLRFSQFCVWSSFLFSRRKMKGYMIN